MRKGWVAFLVAIGLYLGTVIYIQPEPVKAERFLFSRSWTMVDVDSLTTGVATDTSGNKVVIPCHFGLGLVTKLTVVITPTDTITGSVALAGCTVFDDTPDFSTEPYITCVHVGPNTGVIGGTWYGPTSATPSAVVATTDNPFAFFCTGASYSNSAVGAASNVGFYGPYWALRVVSSTSSPDSTHVTVTVYAYGDGR